VRAAGYIGLVIVQIGLLSVATTVRSAQPNRQNEQKPEKAPRAPSAAKNHAQWAADPAQGWVPAETGHEEKKSRRPNKRGGTKLKPTTKQTSLKEKLK
jgi:hypothetical protein